MIKTGKGRSRVRNPWRPLYWMPLIGILLCLMSAKLVLWNKLSETSLTIIPQIIVGIVSFLGSFRGSRLAPRKCFLWGMVNSIVYGAMLLLGNLLFFGNEFSSVGITFLWILGSGIVGSLLANFKKGKIA